MNTVIFLLLLIFCSGGLGLNNCPTSPIRAVIQRAAETTEDAVTQMQMIRRILEDIYGGTWGVLVIRNPSLVSKEVHWTFPDHTNEDGSAAFCLAVVNKWQYNVFRTGQIDSPQRVTIESMIQKFTSGTLPKVGKLGSKSTPGNGEMRDEIKRKQEPKRYSIGELDRMLIGVLDNPRKVRVNRSPKLIQ
ncbi:unnamed protein product [Caenorhabditis angaria]|uniref:Uncharacterized protein n=1 Tax=Caenorhabditis angaria TaxID=860376 RepID=A0A9P1N4W1_9PELO|nr:unnamed protein product [Caenorhabditis angaria]